MRQTVYLFIAAALLAGCRELESPPPPGPPLAAAAPAATKQDLAHWRKALAGCLPPGVFMNSVVYLPSGHGHFIVESRLMELGAVVTEDGKLTMGEKVLYARPPASPLADRRFRKEDVKQFYEGFLSPWEAQLWRNSGSGLELEWLNGGSSYKFRRPVELVERMDVDWSGQGDDAPRRTALRPTLK